MNFTVLYFFFHCRLRELAFGIQVTFRTQTPDGVILWIGEVRYTKITVPSELTSYSVLQCMPFYFYNVYSNISGC